MSLIPEGEVFCDTWTFRAGDPVPVWLEHAQGLASLTFTADTTVYADLHGRFWVVPTIPTPTPIHARGYGDGGGTITSQGQGDLIMCERPTVDLDALVAHWATQRTAQRGAPNG